MRRTTAAIGAKLPYPINPSTRQTLITFSTSSFGRGRGRGAPPPRFDFSTPLRAPGQPPDEAPLTPQEASPLSHDHGRGRGRGQGQPLPPVSPIVPSFSSISSGAGRGRGGGSSFKTVLPPPPPPPPQQQEIQNMEEAPPVAVDDGGSMPESIASLLPGVGRGQPEKHPEIQQHVNRHVQQRRAPESAVVKESKPKEAVAASAAPKMSREEALKHAMEVFSRNEANVGRGRGRGRGRGIRGRGRGRFVKEEEDEKDTWLDVGDDADGARFAQRLGPEKMSELTEAFEEMGEKLIPGINEMHLDALDMNFKLEFEPEFLMGDLESNPDIDEKPPIPLRDALEKAKPFLMAYENIESQEEWEEIMKETMERVPLLKEIVDHYSGPNRVTVKKQHQELDRVAKTLPASAPNSVKQFTERAVLSLQNNPGWGFHRKCQFVDKLVARMSQHYK